MVVTNVASPAMSIEVKVPKGYSGVARLEARVDGGVYMTRSKRELAKAVMKEEPHPVRLRTS